MPNEPIPGRGTSRNPAGRFATLTRALSPDLADECPEPAAATELLPELSKSILCQNNSPDVPFRQSINPYRGCEHGCVYCYARPAHAYVDLSPGLDFETKIFFKPDAANLLRKSFNRPAYRVSTISLGANTDPYQPAERRLGITREILTVMAEYRHPVAIVTKSALVERDLDLLSDLARDNLIRVLISVTSLDDDLKRSLEPRAASPARRLKTIRHLSQAGVPVGALIAPVIPGLNEHELDRLVEAVARAGADHAAYILLRLPWEVRDLFVDWLETHRPLRAKRVMNLLRQFRHGRDNDPCFGSRMRGEGTLAELLGQRFTQACRRNNLATGDRPSLNIGAFWRPPGGHSQMPLF
ncbi:MAG: PA0069 family radical SAM protein [Gammaproteobacteria bacterium]|nr:PA0069 family radical SAM protein [Gammaproteobacteria bacterium]